MDTDTLIEERIGCSIREYFEREGEASFRDLEQAHGTAAVSAWVASVTRADDAPSSDQVAATANAAFGGDIAPRLR